MLYNAMRKNNVIGRKFVERKCVKAECTCTSHRPNILHLISPYLLLAERLGHLADALAGRTRARVLELPLPRCCVARSRQTCTRLPTHAHVRLQQNSLWPRPTPSSSLVKFLLNRMRSMLLPTYLLCSYHRFPRVPTFVLLAFLLSFRPITCQRRPPRVLTIVPPVLLHDHFIIFSLLL